MSENRMKVGCVGLGIMGRPMSLHVQNGGHELHVWARRPESLEPLKAAGANAHNSLTELIQSVDVLITNVSDTPDVEQILLGPSGVKETASPGFTVIDHSTICPVRTRYMAEALAEMGIDFLDAPVSGGEAGAIAGTLTVMVGGKAPVLEKLRPIIDCVAGKITHVGDHGAGQITKACNQLIVAQSLVAVSEAISLAEAGGVDPAAMREALLGGLAYSKVLEVHGQRMLDRAYPPGFKTRLHSKDMGIVVQAAQQLGVPLMGASLAAQWLHTMAEQGRGEEDSAVVAELQRKLAGQS